MPDLVSSRELIQWLPSLAYLLGGILIGTFLNRVVVPPLRKAAFATPWRGDGAVMRAVGNFPLLWCFLLGAHLAFINLPMSFPASLTKGIGATLFVITASTIIIVVSRIAVSLTHYAAERSGNNLATASIFDNIVKFGVIAVGILLILQSLGIAITPILTALGVGGLAVALALQDTLSNLFAGFQILASQHVRPGDYVKLSSGEEGYVRDITWRITTIEALTKVMSVVPNSKLASTIVANYHRPDNEMAVIVPLGVTFDSDLDQVERITIEVAQDVMQTVEGGVPEFEPLVRFTNFESRDAAITFNAVLRTAEFSQQFLVRHEFLKRLQKRYNQEGIRVPYPMQTVRLVRAPEEEETATR